MMCPIHRIMELGLKADCPVCMRERILQLEVELEAAMEWRAISEEWREVASSLEQTAYRLSDELKRLTGIS